MCWISNLDIIVAEESRRCRVMGIERLATHMLSRQVNIQNHDVCGPIKAILIHNIFIVLAPNLINHLDMGVFLRKI